MSAPTMRCTIPEKSIRVFAACVQCLSKVGKEMVLECSRGRAGGATTMTLSTMNDAKTAFSVFTFFQAFFENIHMDAAGLLAIKVPLRSLASVFKSIRTTERMTISMQNQGPRHVVVFSSQCKGGLVKTHELHYEDTSVVHASFDRSEARNRIVARASIFTKSLAHIYGAEEASLIMVPDQGVRLRSHYQHVDRSTELDTLRTDVGIAATELERLEVGLDQGSGEIAFGLKEMKALLQFCELVGVVNVAFLCNGAGSPFLFSTDESLAGVQNMGGGSAGATASGAIQTFQAELVVATLEAEEIQQEADAGLAAATSSSSSSSSVAAKRTRDGASSSSSSNGTGEGVGPAKHARSSETADPMDQDEGSVVPTAARRGERLRASQEVH